MPRTAKNPLPDSGDSGRRKNLRKAQIVFQVWKSGPMARATLAEALHLNLPTVSNCVSDLLASGDLVEEGYANSTGGRKPQLLEVNGSLGSVIGVTFSSRGISSAWSDLRGTLFNSRVYPFSIQSGKGRALSTIREAISDQVDALRAHGSAGPLLQIGLGISGLLDAEKGISNAFPRFEEWNDVPLRELVEEWFGVPAILDSHIAAIALAETIFGRYRNLRNGLYVQLGPGLGLGIIVDGRIYRGSRRNVGEFGHTTIAESGAICYCGNYGCLESVASDYAMVQQAEAAVREGVNTRIPEYVTGSGRITPGAIFRAAQAGDRFATNLLEKIARLLGTGIANLVNLFAPEMVILGGTMAEAGDVLLTPLCSTISTKALERMHKDVEIRTGSFGPDEAIKGAVTLALYQHMVRQVGAANGAGGEPTE